MKTTHGTKNGDELQAEESGQAEKSPETKEEESGDLEKQAEFGENSCLKCLKRLFCCSCCTTSSEMEKFHEEKITKSVSLKTLNLEYQEEKITYGEIEDTIQKPEESKKEISSEKTWKDLFRRWKILKSDESNESKPQKSSSGSNVFEETEPKLNETYRFEVVDKIYQR